MLEVGALVSVIKDDGTRWITRTRSEPWQLGSGHWVVLLEGRAGGYSLSRVSLVKENPTPPRRETRAGGGK
jgi:hypothetical protein